MLVFNEEQNYFILEESNRTKDSQLNDIKREGLKEQDQKIIQNERLNL